VRYNVFNKSMELIMANNFWRAVSEERYLKESGEWQRRKDADERDQRNADRKIKQNIGEDYPNPYKSGN